MIHLLNNIARERITAELEKLLVGQNAVEIITRFEPVFCQVLGVESIDTSAFSYLPPDFALRLASICDGTTLVLSNATRARVKNVRTNGVFSVVDDSASICRALYRFGEDNLCDMLVFENKRYLADRVRKVIASGAVYSLSQLAASGQDVAKLGFAGKDIKTALDKALFAVIDNEIPNNKQQIINYLLK